MSKHLLIATAAFFVTTVGIPIAFAQVACSGSSTVGTTLPATYHGYSDNTANPGAPGASTAVILTTSVTTPTKDCNGTTTITTISKHYTDGPGKSDYSKHDYTISTTCMATGTGVCP